MPTHSYTHTHTHTHTITWKSFIQSRWFGTKREIISEITSRNATEMTWDKGPHWFDLCFCARNERQIFGRSNGKLDLVDNLPVLDLSVLFTLLLPTIITLLLCSSRLYFLSSRWNDLPIDSHLALPSAIQLWSSSQATDTQTTSRSVSWLLLDCYQSSFWIECFIIPFYLVDLPCPDPEARDFSSKQWINHIFRATGHLGVWGSRRFSFLAIRRRKFFHFIVILYFPLSTFEWEKIPA